MGGRTALPIAGHAAKSQTSSPRLLLVLDARTAGFVYYAGGECLSNIKAGDALMLHRESNNAHDHRAIEIFWSEKARLHAALTQPRVV